MTKAKDFNFHCFMIKLHDSGKVFSTVPYSVIRKKQLLCYEAIP